VIKFHIPLIRDDGSLDVVAAYRAQHKTHRLPTKGGTRLSPHMSMEEVEALSFLMTLKNAIMDLPYVEIEIYIKLFRAVEKEDSN
jgi:glutamate dehydrogenase (NAD(P)+)